MAVEVRVALGPPHAAGDGGVRHLAHGRGLKVIIAGAGGAAHLPAEVAALTPCRGDWVPWQSRALFGFDPCFRSGGRWASGIPGHRGDRQRQQRRACCGPDPGHGGSQSWAKHWMAYNGRN